MAYNGIRNMFGNYGANKGRMEEDYIFD